MPLPVPVNRQREVLYLPAQGHVAVLGTAGSGKTTIAIHRAVYLGNPSLPHGGRTLLVTFNKALVAYFRHLGDEVLGHNVKVENYHTFARGYLNRRGKMPRFNGIVNPTRREELIEQAKQSVAAEDPSPILDRSTAVLSEEIAWISRHGVASEQAYESVTRTGRSDARIDRRYRASMWKLYQAYLTLRANAGFLYDWDDIATSVCSEFDNDNTERHYKHIVIDEGQDFSPQMIRSLVKAVPKGGSVTFFGDVAQQIFGKRMSWRSAGLVINDVWRFEQNYRNTAQIFEVAKAISAMSYYRGEDDLVMPEAPKAAGAPPAIVKVSSKEAEIKFVAEQATQLSKTQSVGIILRRREHEDLFKLLLPKKSTRLDKDLQVWHPGAGVHYGTFHAAKGLEFDVVIIPFLSDDYMPDPKDIEELGEADATSQDGRLLYVGVTRARSTLIMTHSGPLSPLLPKLDGICQKMEV
ncbi:3'-5' exonuclease [Azospirillum sp. Marseille-Q6669]